MFRKLSVAMIFFMVIGQGVADEEKILAPESLIKGVWLAPTVTLLGFLTPFRVGVEAKIAKKIALSYETGFFPKFYFKLLGANTDRMPDDFSFSSHSLGFRYFIWGGSFYCGVLLGMHHFSSTMGVPPANLPAESAYLTHASFNQYHLTPMIGWRWRVIEQLFVGIDLGYQIKLASNGSYHITISGDPNNEWRQEIEDVMLNLQSTSLPFISLIKLGYNF